jgi:hypothetical protein
LVGAGKGALETQKGTSDLINTISKYIPDNVKNYLKQQATAKPGGVLSTLAGTLGLMGLVSPGISKVEESTGLQEGQLTTPSNTAQKVGFYGEKVGEFLVPTGIGGKAVKTTLEAKALQKAEQALEQKIAPKLTKFEVGQALKEGRVIRGKVSRIFGKKPDTVIQSTKVKQSANTIQELIPEATKLTDAQLVPKIQKQVATLSNDLKPVLKEAKVSEKVKEDMVSSWLKIKQEQVANVSRKMTKKRFEGAQKEFEDTLLEVADADNLDDVWNIRKKYDDLIPSNVKKATAKSSDALQVEKEMWLENRRVLNEMMDVMSKGLEEQSAKRFSQMSDLYRAEMNIINRADIARKSTGGIFVPKNVLRSGIGLGATAVGLGAYRSLID